MTLEHFIHLADELCISHKDCKDCPAKRIHPCPWFTFFFPDEQKKLLELKDILEDWDYERERDKNEEKENYTSFTDGEPNFLTKEEFVRTYPDIAERTTVTLSEDKDEWYCHYQTCDICKTEFMCSEANFCPGCGRKIKVERGDIK